MPKEPLTEGRKHILRHWRNFRPKYYKYLKELDALKEAVEMAIRNQSNMEKAMLKAGVDSSTARLESTWHFTKLPSEDRQPILEPDQAPLGQPIYPLWED